ncbi:MAG: hypothetical protein LBF08_02745 [Dysgonamonadaceae bacterium]|jgi:hypothetical protein|nr:hypothetical protein [Dysgonamonadaceae bacterium]
MRTQVFYSAKATVAAFILLLCCSIVATAHNMYLDGSITISADGDYTITGYGLPNQFIEVDSNITANITLENVTLTGIDTDSRFDPNRCVFNINPGANVTLTLRGENKITSQAAYPGIRVPTNATLTVNGPGTLEVTGGDGSAGIGGFAGDNCGTITIDGGTITAYGGAHAAGIGGSYLADGGTITINGGTITATGGEYGAGIGGGGAADKIGNSAGTITIDGGTITANGGAHAAGIGGSYLADGGIITINGGTITAYGGELAAAIGGGEEADAGTIIIDGGTLTVEKGSGSNKSAIGPGKNGNGKVVVSGGSVYGSVQQAENEASQKVVPVEIGFMLNRNDAMLISASIRGRGYNVKDVKIMDGKVLFWLPVEDIYRREDILVNIGVSNTPYSNIDELTITDGDNDVIMLNTYYAVNYAEEPISKNKYKFSISASKNGKTTLASGDYFLPGDTISFTVTADPNQQYRYTWERTGTPPIINTDSTTYSFTTEDATDHINVMCAVTEILSSVEFSLTGDSLLGFYTEVIFDGDTVKTGDSIWVASSSRHEVILKVPGAEEDKLYKYTYILSETDSIVAYNRALIILPNVVGDSFKAKCKVEGPFSPIRFKLDGAPAQFSVTYNERLLPDINGLIVDTVLSGGVLSLQVTAVAASNGCDYIWSGTGIPNGEGIDYSTGVSTKTNFNLTGIIDATCTVIPYYPIFFSIVDSTKSVSPINATINATVADTIVENNETVRHGSRLEIAVSGADPQFYGFLWEGDGIENVGKKNASLVIDSLSGLVNVKCTIIRKNSVASLKELVIGKTVLSDPNSGEYEFIVDDWIEEITLSVTKDVQEASISILKTYPLEMVTSVSEDSTVLETYPLEYGQNIFMVTSVSEDSTMQEDFKITVFRWMPTACGDTPPFGNNLTWEFSGDELTIRGAGGMKSYSDTTEYPWYPHADAIKSIVIETGVTSIDDRAFLFCSNLTSIINYSSEPQDISEKTVFGDLKTNLITLYVPHGYEILYKSTPVWRNFNIDEITSPAGISSVGADVKVYLSGQNLYVNTPVAERISVYSVAGTLLNRFEKSAGASAVSAAASQVLIVKGSSGWVRKLVRKVN